MIDLDTPASSDRPILDVSVVAANYNNANFLHDFFEAWLSSTAMPSELIFVDDGSTDNSVEIARLYLSKIPCLQIIELQENKGFGNALNVGIDSATCKYLARIDPDDVVVADRLEKQVLELESGRADVVGSNAYIFQSSGARVVGVSNFPMDHSMIEATIIRGEHGVLHPTVTARTSLFRENKYVQSNVPAEDYDIFARMLSSGARFHNIQEPLLRYRIHQRSASNILPFSTIERTYRIRDEVFGTRTSRTAVRLYYWHIKFYRKHLFAQRRAERLFYLALASGLRPDKAVRRVIRSLRK
ncbi:putative glycosyltransferase EpsE [compost metagenome]|uniref:glycosyltransferase n=1 Tax=Stenotrophomonas lactitubi TaxID=2045214 RepID=UPI000FAE023E|nr:glycosyltransferase [Stenotrophomonas lactitubi]